MNGETDHIESPPNSRGSSPSVVFGKRVRTSLLLLLASLLVVPSTAAAEDWIYTVRTGDNLQGLSSELGIATEVGTAKPQAV